MQIKPIMEPIFTTENGDEVFYDPLIPKYYEDEKIEDEKIEDNKEAIMKKISEALNKKEDDSNAD